MLERTVTTSVLWTKKLVNSMLHLLLFSNNKEGFDFLINSLKPYSKKINSIRYGRHWALPCCFLKFLLSNGYTVALINPKTTDLTRKMEGGITKMTNWIQSPFVMSSILLSVKNSIVLLKLTVLIYMNKNN